MFIYNFKINGTKVFKVFFSFIIILVIIILCICSYRIFNGANIDQSIDGTSNTSPDSNEEDVFVVSDDITETSASVITRENYTTILDDACKNVDKYVGEKITFTGYVYRINDLPKNQFVLARNMLMSSNTEYVVVGFICEGENVEKFENNSWVKVTGEIEKGAYHGSDMPIVKITEISLTNKPNEDEEFVNSPNN